MDRPRVGYLGPQGTFTEEALLSGAAAGSVEPVPLQTIYDTVQALRRGELEWAVVPIENSLEGSVSVTLDLLAGEDGDLRIAGETLVLVRHSLIAAEPVELSEIQTVLTHPQVPGQCTRFLRGELAHATVLPASSTAEAVRAVAREPSSSPRRRSLAALGTALAAHIYGAVVLREGVQDRDDNETRFVWLGRRATADGGAADGGAAEPGPPLRDGGGGDWKTSVVFWGAGAERPGWLVRCLDEFARREINLTRIESRTRRERLGSYMFFADLTGRAGEGAVAQALAGLRGLCEEVRVLGSYRGARPALAPALQDPG